MSNAVLDPQTTRSATILQRSVCFTLACHYLGNVRKVELSDLDLSKSNDHEKINKDQLKLTKHLVDPKELRSAMRVLNAAKAYLRSAAIPTPSVFGERSYLIPLGLVEQVDGRLREFALRAEVESALLAERYPSLLDKAKKALGPHLFNAAQYPTVEDVRHAFRIDWDYVSFAAPDRLETVDRALFESAQAKFQTKMADAYEEVRYVLRETLLELSKGIVEKLTPGPDGKPKIFRNSVLDGLSNFLSTFDMRNITDDAELTRVVSRLKGLTHGLEPEALRDFDVVRATVLDGVREATKELDGLVTVGRGRAISFD